MCFECFRNSSPEHSLVKLLLIYMVNRYENINNINVYHSKNKGVGMDKPKWKYTALTLKVGIICSKEHYNSVKIKKSQPFAPTWLNSWFEMLSENKQVVVKYIIYDSFK